MGTRPTLGGLVLASIMVGSLLLSSCSTTNSPAPAGSSTNSPTAAVTQAPTKPYGSLTITSYFGSTSLDPVISATANNFQGLGAEVFDTLVGLSPEGQFVPALAERWEISKDGMSHTFYIRKGVKFHDESDLTAADVKFSFERITAPDSVNIDAGIWRSSIAGIDVKDDYTVVIRMKGPQFELLKGFNDFGPSQAVVPKKYIEEKGVDNFRKNPVGSGRFKVVKFEAGNRLELEANESYWGEVAKFKNITVLKVSEEATKVAMLKTGELDIADISPDSVSGLKSAGLRVLSHDGASQHALSLYYDLDSPDQYALGGQKVRKALSLALNRQEIADKIYGGYADPSAMFYARPTGYFWDPSQLKPDPYDPEGAKKLLSEGGYPNGFNTKLWSPPDAKNPNIDSALVGYWRNIGVKADLAPIDQATLRSMRTPPKVKADLFNTIISMPASGGGLQFEKMVTAYHSTKSSLLNTRNSRLDELIDKVPATQDQAEKKRLALEAAILAKNEYSQIPVSEIRTIFALGSKVGGVTPTKGVTLLAYNYASITHAK